jgi:hypothetical protein
MKFCDTNVIKSLNKYNVFGAEVEYPLQKGDSPSNRRIDETFPPKGPGPDYLEISLIDRLRSEVVVNTFAETAQDQEPPALGSPGVNEFDVVIDRQEGS